MNHVLSWEPSPTATNSATTPTSGALGTLRREGIRPAERSGLGTSPPNNNNNNTNNTLTRSPPCHSPSTTDAISSTMMYNHYGSTHTTPDLRPRRWVSELGSMAAFALEPAALAKAAAAPSSIDPHVAPWRHDSDALRGWQLLSSGGCVRQRNPTASHLVLITEEGLRNTATAFSRSRSRTPSVGAANTDVIAATTTTTTTTTAASVLIPVDAAPSHEEHTSSGSSRGCSATDLPNNNNNNNVRSVRWAHDDEDAAHRTPIPSTGDEKSYSSATGAVERLALSCADVILLRAAVPLPHGKSEACFVAQVQRLPYRANNMRPPTSTTTGSDAAATTTTTTTRQPTSLFAMAITPRANEEANTKTGIPALVLRVDEPSGDATLCVEMWRVVPLADHAERVRVVEEAVDLELTNDRVLLRLVVRDGGFDVYADDVLVFDGVEAEGAKLGEATAIFFASGGCHSLRQIAIAEGERPPSSRFLQPLRRESVEEEANEDVPPPAARSVRNSNTSSAARTPTQSCAAAKPTTTTTSERNSPKRGANNNNNAAAARPPPPASAPSKRSPPRVGGAPTRHVDPSATTPPTATTPTAKTSTRRSLAPTSSPSTTTPPSSSSLANTPARNNTNNNNNNTNNTKNTRRQVPKRRAACTSDDVDDPRRSVADLPPDIDPTLAAYIQAEVLDTSPNVSWDDVVGVGAAKRLLKEAVLLPLLVPELFVGVVQPWRGVLLYGPPGTGKTMLAKAVATSAKTTFFGMSAASLTSKHYGESEKLVRTLFQLARLYAPSTIFIDEVDALMSSRGGSEHEASRRIKSELLQQMDGLPSQADNKRVLVFGITNRPWDLDEAMRRRMEKRVYVPLLDRDGRLQLLQQLTSTLVMEEEVQLDEMATSLEGYSGADISMVVRDAAMMPVRRLMDAHGPEELTAMQHAGTLEVSRISAEDFCVAQRRSRPSVSQGSLGEFERWTEDFGSA